MSARRTAESGGKAAPRPQAVAGAVTALYGIPNCDQVKKARAWLDAHPIDYVFHDFKKQGLSAALAHAWLDEAGAERVINRKGSTWRTLDDARKALVDKASGAATLICEQPSLVKRPVLRHNGALTIGFDADHYKTLFP